MTVDEIDVENKESGGYYVSNRRGTTHAYSQMPRDNGEKCAICGHGWELGFSEDCVRSIYGSDTSLHFLCSDCLQEALQLTERRTA